MKKKCINKKTKKIIKACVPMHSYGHPCRIDEIKQILKRHYIFLIEDAAEMIGHKINGKPCGFYGHISTFSFYANKHITTGEGGAILTNSSKLFNKINSLRNLCFGKINRYNHNDIGWNYRFTNIQAALGLSQIKRIKWIIQRKIFF